MALTAKHLEALAHANASVIIPALRSLTDTERDAILAVSPRLMEVWRVHA